MVIKKDKRREEFNREKLMTGIRKACEKRPLQTGTIDKMIEEIETELYQLGRVEISSSTIGEKVIEKLKNVDYIAYIRFASVYREFADITALKKAVDSLIEKPVAIPSNQLSLLPGEGVEAVAKSGHRSRR